MTSVLRPNSAASRSRTFRPGLGAVRGFARWLAVGLIGAVAVAAAAACGAGPREVQLNPGPPAFPPPFFTPDLPPPQLIGATTRRLETARVQLTEAEAERPDQMLYIEYFSNHPYVLAVHYVIGRENRVERLEYELTPRILTALGTRMALFGDLLAAYGEPEQRGPHEWLWRFDNYQLRWHGVVLYVTRQQAS